MTHPHRHEPPADPIDAQSHASLRAAGPSLPFADDPTESDLNRWTQPPAAIPFRAEPRRASGEPHRLRRLGRVATAAAALVAVVGGVWIAGGGSSKVQAATILNSLRTSTFSGLHMTFKGVRVSGFEAAGEAWASFSDERTPADLFGADGTDGALQTPLLDVRSLSLRATVTGDAESEMPGAECEVAVGLSATEGWAHIKSQTPGPIAERLGPSSEGIAAALPRGLLLRFGGSSSSTGGNSLPPGLLDGVDLGQPGVHVKSLPPGTAMPPAGVQSSTQVMVKVGSAGPGGAAAAGLVPLLQGQAGVAQLRQFAQLLSQSGGQGEVVAQPDGTSILRVTGAKGLAGREFATTMTVCYREGTGVQWVEFTGVGDRQDSSIRIETFTGDIAPALLSPASLVSDDTTTLDLRGSQ